MTGLGQGGYTCHQFVQKIDEPVTVALRSPIPLETDLEVVAVEERWHLLDPANPTTVILEAQRWQPSYPVTQAVGIDQAHAARDAFVLGPDEHPAPDCPSCGIGPDSLRVHPGPLGDGRWATPLRMPTGPVDESLVWMAIDCAAGRYVSYAGTDPRSAVTVQLAVDVIGPIEPDTEYVLVAWHGDYDTHWDGRKRGAAAAMFDRGGACVAQSRSFWLALDQQLS